VEECILAASKLYYGLSTKGTRSLGYWYSVRIIRQFQPAGMTNSMLLVIGCRRSLNGRTHYPFSLHKTRPGKATSFSKHSIEMFVADLCKLYVKYTFHCQFIYNVGETTATNVPKVTRILARKGVKQVGAVTFAEREVHHGRGCKCRWEFYSPVLCIFKKELSGLLQCKWT
jgi:hypothetical protein